MSSDVIWHIRDKLWPMPKHGSIRKVYACLAVTCHLHFWQNDRDFLRATVVTRGWNGYRNKSQHRKSTLEKKISPRRSSRDSNPRPFNHESGALTTELSPPPPNRLQVAARFYSQQHVQITRRHKFDCQREAGLLLSWVCLVVCCDCHVTRFSPLDLSRLWISHSFQWR